MTVIERYCNDDSFGIVHCTAQPVNPADDASRGLLANELRADHRFLLGPQFLQQHPDECSVFPDAIRRPVSNLIHLEHLISEGLSQVKSAKPSMVWILTNQVVTDEVLITTLTFVENILNGRPLTYSVLIFPKSYFPS